MASDRVVLKPNDEQRALLNSIKSMVGLESIHGADQKTIYWALEVVNNVYHLFALEKLLLAKGLNSLNKEEFKSPKYKNVRGNAKKSEPKIMW